MILLFTLIKTDTDATCMNDQVLGYWEFKMTNFSIKPINDEVYCNKDLITTKTKRIQILAPNLAIDQDGYYGTWTFAYTQAMAVKVGGIDYLIYFDYERNKTDDNYVITYCNRTKPQMGWAHYDGVSRPEHACVTATNIQPVLANITNNNKKPKHGPVNIDVDGREYRLLPRGLGQKVPYGPTLQQFKVANEKLFGNADYSGDKLPKSFDWRNVSNKSYVPKTFDQKACGSCFICATAYMMMSRIAIQKKTPGDFVALSIQHVVDCNKYSQGCSGGFGEHVGKFAEDFGILAEKDYGAYLGVEKPCHAKDVQGERYYFQSTQALGGYVGAVTDPLEMQWELFRNGPMAVSVNVDAKFRARDPYGLPNHKNQSDVPDPNRHYFYDQVNHLVLLVGWITEIPKGKDKEETFWIIQNSWNESWGDKGTMKIIMGQNAYAIESQPITTNWRKQGAVIYPPDPEPTVTNTLTGTNLAIMIVLAIAVGVLAIGLGVVVYLHIKSKKAPYTVIKE